MSSETFQLPIEAAEAYEAAFVPAFFAQWAPMICDLARVAPGQSVLDVACGTGIVTRTAADRVGPEGEVVGLDLNEAMLTVARRVRSDLTWRQGDAAALPFPDGSFDAVLCQMALMFFPDRPAALQEMARVAVPGGFVALAVPGRLEAQAAFAPLFDLVVRYAGEEARALLSAYFVCGDLDELAALVDSAGLDVSVARTELGTYRAPSVDEFVRTEVESTPLAERITEDEYARVRGDARDLLAAFVAPDGSFIAPFEVNLVAACRPASG